MEKKIQGSMIVVKETRKMTYSSLHFYLNPPKYFYFWTQFFILIEGFSIVSTYFMVLFFS